jgi:CheY-like chemotaxis protein
MSLQAGIKVSAEASNGLEAINLIKGYAPDIVVMDVQMPVMDGLEATKIIKRNWPQIKVVVLTMYPNYQPEAMSAGADASANQIINSYEGNLSQKEVRSLDMLSFFGRSGFFIAEAVKFKAPNPGWKLNSVKLVAWDGFNGTVESIPSSREIGLEVRDKDLNLLYKFADSQLPYSNYAQNATLGYPMTIEVPSIPVSDDFYI